MIRLLLSLQVVTKWIESFNDPVAKSVATILAIFVLVFVVIFMEFWGVPVERKMAWFWIKVLLIFSAILAVIFWLLLVITGR